MATTRNLRLLLIEDSEEDAELVIQTLARAGFAIEARRVDSREALQSALGDRTWDLAIADHTMPRFSGTAALTLVRDREPHLPFIFVSGTIGEDAAVAAMKSGAQDYIMKGNLKRLVPAVLRELQEAARRRDHKRAEEQLAHLTHHDLLTELPNRFLLHDRLTQAVHAARRDHRPVTLLVMDLDGFKEINNTLSHVTGDQVLRGVGERLRARLRECDTAARLGGDEFAVILAATDLEEAKLTAQRMLQDLSRPFVIDGQPLVISASIGIAQFPEHASTVETLLQKAEIGMYVAKAEASGIALYTADRDHHTHRRLALPGELRDAFERDQFVVEYQPIMRLATFDVIGVEALVRWDHPRHGRLNPNEFIHVAEQIGSIGALTTRVLDRALADCPAAAAMGISANLSPRCLDDPELPSRIAELLQKHGASPSMLTLEITENIIMLDQARSRKCLARLREMGVRLSIDDFGTGYSSLTYLRRLAVDELKIDSSFVADLAKGDEVIVRSTVELAHNLGLTVVAEGVESRLACDRLRAFGCDAVQGQLISRPLPAHELLPWLKRFSKARERWPNLSEN